VTGEVECYQQILTMEYVDDIKHRNPFIAADGQSETQRISEYSYNSCSVVGIVEVCL